MKAILASLVLVGFMSCAHHGSHDHGAKDHNHGAKCADESCELKGTKSCCQAKKEKTES